MAGTITFRPKPGIAEALDARSVRAGDRSLLINRALAQYLGVTLDDDEAATTPPLSEHKGRARKARQAVPDPPDVEMPECPHPKQQRKQLPYGTQCLDCGQMVR